jgi:hypothetical protein
VCAGRSEPTVNGARGAGIDAYAFLMHPVSGQTMKEPKITVMPKNWDPFAEKRRARRRDRMRLARGEVTPEQLQRENAFIKNPRECKIVDPNPANRFL